MTGSEEPAAWLGLIHGAAKGAVASMPTHANPRSRERPGVAAGAKDTNWKVPPAHELRRGATSHAVDSVWATVTLAQTSVAASVSAAMMAWRCGGAALAARWCTATPARRTTAARNWCLPPTGPHKRTSAVTIELER